MAYGIPTDVASIIAAISFKLVETDLLFQANQVWVTLASDKDLEELPMKDQMVTIRPDSFTAVTSEVRGGGRNQFSCNGTLSLSLWSRLWTGQLLNDWDALQDASKGILTLWMQLLDSLEQFAPQAAGCSDCLLREPMRLMSFTVVPVRLLRRGWTRLDSTWSIKYVQRFS